MSFHGQTCLYPPGHNSRPAGGSVNIKYPLLAAAAAAAAAILSPGLNAAFARRVSSYTSRACTLRLTMHSAPYICCIRGSWSAEGHLLLAVPV